VDDEDALREIAEFQLEDLGYEVIAAENGQQALDLMRKDPEIFLLFSDVVMPGELDGYQLASAVHELRPNVKILLTSGFTKAREEMLLGNNPYLATLAKRIVNKPYNLRELAVAVRSALDHS